MRTDGSGRVADLSCEKLFMNYQDINSGLQASREEAGTLEDADWWAGEPSLNGQTVRFVPTTAGAACDWAAQTSAGMYGADPLECKNAPVGDLPGGTSRTIE